MNGPCCGTPTPEDRTRCCTNRDEQVILQPWRVCRQVTSQKNSFGRRTAAISMARALPLCRAAKQPGLCKAFTGPTPSSREREYTQREEPDYCESTRHFISHPSLKSPVCSACRAGGVDTASVPLAGRGDCPCR